MLFCFFVFFKQKTAYEMRISDWSSDVCSSDLQRIKRSQTAFGAGNMQRGEDENERANDFGNQVGRRIANGRAGAEDRELRVRLIGDFAIGSASCRERVCQYV